MLVVYGFKPMQGAKAEGMGFQEEVSPTLNATNSCGGGEISQTLEVGQRIIDDAEGISIGPENIREIKITARIRPSEEVTSVCYEIQKYADPRRKM